MIANIELGWPAMGEGRGAEVERRLHHRDSLAGENALASHQMSALKHTLAQEMLSLKDGRRCDRPFAEIIGTSAALRHVLHQVETVAPTDATILITGETGTGKELIAHAIHELSQRRGHAFVQLNCAAIPTGLLESELFGHEKGAFTGAVAQRIGRFELAHRGTLFLDEIGEIPLEVQPKLLRVLQEQEFERLGSPRTLRTDARLIAATNRDLPTMVRGADLPRRPLLPLTRLSRARASVAGASGRYSAAGAPFHATVRPPDAQNDRDHSRQHHAGAHPVSLAGEHSRAAKYHRAGGDPLARAGVAGLSYGSAPAGRGDDAEAA